MSSPDVIVIGGGMAGVSIAYELAAHRSVVLLEAESALATHTTARSAATWIPRHGTAAFRALISASGPRFSTLADELGAAPFLTTRPMLWAAFDDEAEHELDAMLAERAGEPDEPVRLTAAQTRKACPVLRTPRAGALTDHPTLAPAARHQHAFHDQPCRDKHSNPGVDRGQFPRRRRRRRPEQ